MRAVLAILVLCSENLAIRVPIAWDGNSEVQNESQKTEEFQLPQQSSSLNAQEKPIPIEYFQYTANKPAFAVDLAQFHGVPNPQAHYKAYPVRPYTGVQKPQLGQHLILNSNRPAFQNFQEFAQLNDQEPNFANPVKSNYEVFHPYKAEQAGLTDIYKDPVLEKIRNDIRDSQTRLQNYENEAGKPNIEKDEYLEDPKETDRKKIPHRNIPTQFEIHKPQRRPIYYQAPPKYSREHILNHKFRHPWNQHNPKIRPLHYRPLKNHLHRLRQHHAIKFDDERNQYPQPPPAEAYAELTDGYDIYEKGKEKYVKLRNNVDESINNAVQQNRPTRLQKLELQNNKDELEAKDSDEEDFVPIKNYAQVRKTESIKHLPREAAFADAESFDEIKNAPRLREAIKSTKAQTVYTEEGYEDAAYDHAGEQKHASENEAHAGYLKEKEISGGKYKAPELAAAYQDAGGNEHRDLVLHGEKWKNDDKEEEKDDDSDDFSEDETADYIEEDVYKQVNGDRNKRDKDSTEKSRNSDKTINESQNLTIEEDNQNDSSSVSERETDTVPESSTQHELNKRETDDKQGSPLLEKQETPLLDKPFVKFKVPEINFTSTFLTEEELDKIAKMKIETNQDDIQKKYPYYFKNLKNVHKDSPLRYAENLKLIPKKSEGGTEFYDSRIKFECPEIDEEVDPLPEKLKKDGHPDESEEGDKDSPKKKGDDNFDSVKNNPRLKGLGDKIDCFKAKFFGENPLDSPFFKEELISNPEPITLPPLDAYKLKQKELTTQESQLNNIFKASDKLKNDTKSDVFALLQQLRNGQQNLQDSLLNTKKELKTTLIPQNFSIIGNPQSSLLHQDNVYSDILGNIESSLQRSLPAKKANNKNDITSRLLEANANKPVQSNVTYESYQNKEQVMKPTATRRKRAATFVYEPYKIIRDVQVPESKKTTTTSNVSPLIKQLQSSRVVDRVSKNEDQPVKRNVATRTYKDIDRNDRNKSDKGSRPPEPTIIDISVDERRGEPRYEIVKPNNHKSKYTPVDNKKSISVEDYEAKINKTINANEPKPKTYDESTETSQELPKLTLRTSKPTITPYYDVNAFIPKPRDIQTPSASNNLKKIVKSTTIAPETEKADKKTQIDDNDEDYEEYDDDEEITTTTTKPHFRRRRPSSTTTTAKPQEEEEVEELPKLRLITRFHTTTTKPYKQKTTAPPVTTKYNTNDTSPKYREKKRKSTKSTLVTDTKSYGEDDEDDMMKDVVDRMIGVKHDMDEYIPSYEKEKKLKSRNENDGEDLHNKEDYDDDDDDDYDGEEDDDEEDDEDFDDSEDEESGEDEENEPEPPATTPEPTRRTLIRTTEAPPSTTEARSAKLIMKPIVTKKKIEIHKELPVNNSSPHITQFKQDIQEEEIIKEIPSKPMHKKPLKNTEALELYKDVNLPKEVNKLGAVEVFKENLDLRQGPRHGGNYRRAPNAELIDDDTPTSVSPPRRSNVKARKDSDAEASQSESKKAVELTNRKGRFRSRNEGRSAKLELDETSERPSTRFMHGGNLQRTSGRSRGDSGPTAKLIELDENEDDNDSPMHGGNFKSYGNSNPPQEDRYSAKIVQGHNDDSRTDGTATSNARTNAAVLLNSFVQAAPILTTTPAYILDPSKRMYYYVEP